MTYKIFRRSVNNNKKKKIVVFLFSSIFNEWNIKKIPRNRYSFAWEFKRKLRHDSRTVAKKKNNRKGRVILRRTEEYYLIRARVATV